MVCRTLSLLLALLVLVGAWGLPARAQDTGERAPEIRELLEQRDRQIKDVLDDGGSSFTDVQRAQLKGLINGLIDFEAMGRQALGPHWADLTTAQQEEFVAVFADVVRAQSLSDLEVYRSPVTYERIDVDGDSAYVHTTTVYKSERIPVDYVLAFDADAWRAHDIVVDEVSTVGGYKRSFQTVVRKRGFDTLMTSLRKKQQSLTTAGR